MQIKLTGQRDKKKWDVDLIRQLYLSGYDVPEITKLDKFKHLSLAYLQKLIYTNRWHELRKKLREQAKALGDIQLVDLFKAQGDKHYRFMVQQLDKHRELIEKRAITPTREGQGKDLSLLNDYDALARRVLGLDKDDNPKDRNVMALHALINIQQNGPTKAPDVASAVEVLPSDQNQSLGILAQKNGISAIELNGHPVITEANGYNGHEKTTEDNKSTVVSWSGEIRGKS